MVHSLDRLARDPGDLRSLVQKLTRKGVRIGSVEEHLVYAGEDSPLTNLMFSVMGVFVDFERALIGDATAKGSPWA